jgi:aryl-alcohol dehydrogenase-like predicted oxidoreductase
MVKPLETRLLGRTAIRTPRLGLGCATFGREIDETKCFELMDYAVGRGMNLFDTAESYGGGEARDYRKSHLNVDDIREIGGEHHSSEKIIGRWLRATGSRKQIVLVSKIAENFTRRHVRQALEASLERLGTDYLDVYLFHSFDGSMPLEQALEAMDEVQRSGLVRAGGCSNFSAAQLREALDLTRRLNLHRLEVVEGICNLAVRDAEKSLLPLCRKEDIGFWAYSPLGAGFLSGKYSHDRNALPAGSRFHVIPGHVDIYFSDENFKTVAKLHATAQRWGIDPLQLAMAWVLEHHDITTVLCGARQTSHLANALTALDFKFPPEFTWPVQLRPRAELQSKP